MNVTLLTEETMQVLKPIPEHLKRYTEAVGSRKRSVIVSEGTAGRGVHLLSYWDGGSRDQYIAFRDGKQIDIPVGGAPGFTPTPAQWIPQSGDVLVEYGVFCGKPATPRITFYK